MRFETSARCALSPAANGPRSTRYSTPSALVQFASAAVREHRDGESLAGWRETSWLCRCRPPPGVRAAPGNYLTGAGFLPSSHDVRNAHLNARWHHRSWRSNTASRPVLPASYVHWCPIAPVRHNAPAGLATHGLVPHVPAAAAIAWLLGASAAASRG